jgi:hypothetical protein
VQQWLIWLAVAVPLLALVLATLYRGKGGIGTALVVLLVVSLVSLGVGSIWVPVARASPDVLYLHQNIPSGWPGREMNTAAPLYSAINSLYLIEGPSNQNHYWYTETYPTGDDEGSIAAGEYRFTIYYRRVPRLGSIFYWVEVGYCDPDGTNYTFLTRSGVQTVDRNTTVGSPVTFSCGSTSSTTYFYPEDPKRLRCQIHWVSGKDFEFYYDDASYPTNLETPTIVVPENLWLLLPAAGAIPPLVRRLGGNSK